MLSKNTLKHPKAAKRLLSELHNFQSGFHLQSLLLHEQLRTDPVKKRSSWTRERLNRLAGLKVGLNLKSIKIEAR